MKTIKDILKSDSIEQRRRIAKTLAISKEDKNALIVNQSNGGGGNGINIEYYKLKVNGVDNPIIFSTVYYSSSLLKFKDKNTVPTTYIGPASLAKIIGESSIDTLAFGFIDKKLIVLEPNDADNIEIQGTLQERADYFATMIGEDKINISDYFEPITEEEFYNIKPE